MSIQKLTTYADLFVNEDGSYYNWRGHIDFMMFFRSLDGQPLEPLMKERYDLGSRGLVTLFMAKFIEDKDPLTYGSRFFHHIKPFAQALRNNCDMYWRPIVFADMQVFGWNLQQQRDFLNRCAEEFNDEWNVLPSLVNEWSKNGIYPDDFSRPNTNNIWSRGSSVGDAGAPYPGWGYKEWHGRRDWPKVLWSNDDAWYVKEGLRYNEDNGHLEQYDRPMPTIVGEPIGFWDRDIPNRRSSDPNLAAVMGGTSVYSARGADFMSQEGLRCESFTPRTAECARRFFNAINVAQGE